MSDTSPLSMARDTIFGIVATWLALGSNDLSQFPNVPKDTVGTKDKPPTGHRTFIFEAGQDPSNKTGMYFVSQRPARGLLVYPGVNVYFGDQPHQQGTVAPERRILPVFIHILINHTSEAIVGEKRALRLSKLIEDGFQSFGGRLPLHDFTLSPPSPQPGSNVWWNRQQRGTWKELGDPTTETYTNRQWAFQVAFKNAALVLTHS